MVEEVGVWRTAVKGAHLSTSTRSLTATEETLQRTLCWAEGFRSPEDVGELPEEGGTWVHQGGPRGGQALAQEASERGDLDGAARQMRKTAEKEKQGHRCSLA